MRYIVVTANEDSNYMQTGTHGISSTDYVDLDGPLWDLCLTILSPFITGLDVLDSLVTLFQDFASEPEIYHVGLESLTFTGSTAWTRQYIQVWDDNSASWTTAYCIAYVNTLSYCSGTRYNPEINAPELVISDYARDTIYSPNYFSSIKFDLAIDYFLYGSHHYDEIGSVYFGIGNGEDHQVIFSLDEPYMP